MTAVVGLKHRASQQKQVFRTQQKDTIYNAQEENATTLTRNIRRSCNSHIFSIYSTSPNKKTEPNTTQTSRTESTGRKPAKEKVRLLRKQQFKSHRCKGCKSAFTSTSTLQSPITGPSAFPLGFQTVKEKLRIILVSLIRWVSVRLGCNDSR